MTKKTKKKASTKKTPAKKQPARRSVAAKKAPPKRSTAEVAATKRRTQDAINAAAQSVVDQPAETNGVPEERIQGTPDQRQDAARRAEECNRAIEEVLMRFRCRLVPVLNPQLKMVGGSPTEPSSEGIVSCTYGIAPLV